MWPVSAYRTMLTVLLAGGEDDLASSVDGQLRARPAVARAIATDPHLALLALLANEAGARAEGASVADAHDGNGGGDANASGAGGESGAGLPLAPTGVTRAVLEALDLGAPATVWADQGPLLHTARVMTPALWYGFAARPRVAGSARPCCCPCWLWTGKAATAWPSR